LLFDLKPFGVIHFIIGYRLWQGLAGLITALLAVYFLSAEQQGWYFTFMSLAALYSIFEMGLSLVVVQVIAKLFLDIRWGVCGEIIGRNRVQLLAILQSGLRVYFVLAGLFIVCSLIVGWWMFRHASIGTAEAVRWKLPWLGLVILTASSMILLFFWAILEGAGKLLEVYRLRLYLAVAGSVLCWLILSMGGFLWATLAIPLIGTIFGIGWMSLYQKKILSMALSRDPTAMNYWNREVWPLQWRVGIYWISIFMMSQLVTPILFLSQGAIIAGQMGLSLTIAHMVGIIAQACIARCVPDMTQAVARHDWPRLDAIFRKNFRNSIIIFFASIVPVVILYWAAGDWGFSKRLLPWQEMVGLMVFVFSYHLHNAWAAQLRSFHKEPLGGTFLVGAGLILLGSVMIVDRFSAAGAVIIMVVVQAIFILPTSWWIWRRCNQQWRQ
jgi:hypothetical protein